MPGVDVMPRRPTTVLDVPLWLIPQVILEWIRKVGEELEWLEIRRRLKSYVIRMRTKPVNRRFRWRDVPVPVAAGGM
jgi:hypothetical protein